MGSGTTDDKVNNMKKLIARVSLTIALAVLAMTYSTGVSLAEDPVPTCPVDPPNCGAAR